METLRPRCIRLASATGTVGPRWSDGMRTRPRAALCRLPGLRPRRDRLRTPVVVAGPRGLPGGGPEVAVGSRPTAATRADNGRAPGRGRGWPVHVRRWARRSGSLAPSAKVRSCRAAAVDGGAHAHRVLEVSRAPRRARAPIASAPSPRVNGSTSSRRTGRAGISYVVSPGARRSSGREGRKTGIGGTIEREVHPGGGGPIGRRSAAPSTRCAGGEDHARPDRRSRAPPARRRIAYEYTDDSGRNSPDARAEG